MCQHILWQPCMHPLAANLLQSPILAALPIIMQAELMLSSPACAPAHTISFQKLSDVTGCSEIGTCRVKAPVTVGVASPDVEVIKESYRGRVTLLAQHG